jgi:hypothetical protein
MKNLLKEEISQIQYLFGYKKGVVISEQTDPEKKNEYLKKMEIAKGKNYMFEALYFDYLSQDKDVTALNNRIDQEKIKEINDEYIKSNPTNTQTTDTSTPSLPKAESANNLGNVPKDTWEQMQETANTKPNYYTGEGKNIDRETAKKMARSKAQSSASKNLNKPEVDLSPILINGKLTQDGDGSYIYRALYYIA